MAGFSYARGDYVVTLDADLQNPPEEIGKLVEKLDEGYDYVGTIRQQRQDVPASQERAHRADQRRRVERLIPIHLVLRRAARRRQLRWILSGPASLCHARSSVRRQTGPV